MKTRNGFVSNSSSSSFIIAIPIKATVCKCCNRSNDWLLEAATKYLTTLTEKGNEMWTMTSQESVLEYFKEELNKLAASKKYSEKQLEIIAEIETDPTVYANYERLKQQLERFNWKITLPEEAGAGEFLTPKRKIEERKETIQKHLEGYDEKMERIKNLIAKMQKYKSSDYNVYAFTIANWATKAEEALKSMIRDGIVECIDKVVT